MKKLIIANWKAKLDPRESLDLAKKYSKMSDAKNNVVVCPDFTAVQQVATILKGSKMSLGAQNCSVFSPGAYTGEVTAAVLKKIGVKYVIIGHSERRAAGESERSVFEKLIKVLELGLVPVLCIGETANERKNKKTTAILKKQLESALAKLPKKLLEQRIVIAYEPVWAIGSGRELDPEETEIQISLIKKWVFEIGGVNSQVLYGGSVDSQNCSLYLNQKSVDGLLVGGASLDYRVFDKIINC